VDATNSATRQCAQSPARETRTRHPARAESRQLRAATVGSAPTSPDVPAGHSPSRPSRPWPAFPSSATSANASCTGLISTDRGCNVFDQHFRRSRRYAAFFGFTASCGQSADSRRSTRPSTIDDTAIRGERHRGDHPRLADPVAGMSACPVPMIMAFWLVSVQLAATFPQGAKTADQPSDSDTRPYRAPDIVSVSVVPVTLHTVVSRNP
jgi:hypothetical protein